MGAEPPAKEAHAVARSWILDSGAECTVANAVTCNDAREVSRHPQLRSRDFFVTLDYPELGAQIEHPAFFAKAGGVAIRCRAPRIGEHNDWVYGELGIEAAEQAELQSRGVI